MTNTTTDNKQSIDWTAALQVISPTAPISDDEKSERIKALTEELAQMEKLKELLDADIAKKLSERAQLEGKKVRLNSPSLGTIWNNKQTIGKVLQGVLIIGGGLLLSAFLLLGIGGLLDDHAARGGGNFVAMLWIFKGVVFVVIMGLALGMIMRNKEDK